jgi:hypothetical protein
MPILTGERWIAPGEYRINMLRTDEEHCTLIADGSALALAQGVDSGVVGEIAEAGKPSKKLAVEWEKNGQAALGNQPARIVVQFGPTQWRGSVLVLGGTTVKVPGGRLTVFHVPAAHLEALEDKAVPIGVLSKGKDGDKGSWNLVVHKSEARLVPWMTAPRDQFGFGAIAAPDESLQSKGPMTITAQADQKELAALELLESSLANGELVVVAAFGLKTLELRVPEPKADK